MPSLREPRAGIHPENAVVMGAAIYAAMLSGQTLSRAELARYPAAISGVVLVARAVYQDLRRAKSGRRPPLLIGPIAESRYRATGGVPFVDSVEADSPEAAIAKLQADVDRVGGDGRPPRDRQGKDVCAWCE